jgi:putative restriction endonuclease
MRAAPLQDQALAERVRKLKVWKRGGRYAPHKPLLLLLALGRVQRHKPRLVLFEEIEKSLGSLLEQFGPTKTTPSYPFWRLQKDELWEVQSDRPMRARQGNTDPPVTELRASNAKGGFPSKLDSYLRARPAEVVALAQTVLDDHFPPSLHADIADAADLTLDADSTPRPRIRDPKFRNRILTAYEHRCAVCGYDALLDGRVVGLEAAHVMWHTHGGPSSVDNGLALCPLHHKALDLGLITIAHNHVVLVSSRATGGLSVSQMLLCYHGRPVIGPQHGQPRIHADFQQWHSAQVFKTPERVSLPT